LCIKGLGDKDVKITKTKEGEAGGIFWDGGEVLAIKIL
jgi:hypothetical protein